MGAFDLGKLIEALKLPIRYPLSLG